MEQFHEAAPLKYSFCGPHAAQVITSPVSRSQVVDREPQHLSDHREDTKRIGSHMREPPRDEWRLDTLVGNRSPYLEAPALMRRANLLGNGGSAEDAIGRVLRLSGGVNQKLAVVAKLPE